MDWALLRKDLFTAPFLFLGLHDWLMLCEPSKEGKATN